MSKRMKTVLVLFFGLALCLTTLGSAWAEYPDRPLTMIVSFGPGGATDLSSRALAKALEKQLGQSIIVQNKPGVGRLWASPRSPPPSRMDTPSARPLRRVLRSYRT